LIFVQPLTMPNSAVMVSVRTEPPVRKVSLFVREIARQSHVVLSPIPQTMVAVLSHYLPDKLPAQSILQVVPEDAAEQSQPLVMPQALGLAKVIIAR